MLNEMMATSTTTPFISCILYFSYRSFPKMYIETNYILFLLFHIFGCLACALLKQSLAAFKHQTFPKCKHIYS